MPELYQDVDIVVARPPPPQRAGPEVRVREAAPDVGDLLENARVQMNLTVDELAREVKMPVDRLLLYETSQLQPDLCAMHIFSSVLKLGMRL